MGSSVQGGEVIDFKINTPSDKYRIDIYRIGFYNGNGARKVDTIRPVGPLPQEQPPCYFEEETMLYDCGTWQVGIRIGQRLSLLSLLYVSINPFLELVLMEGVAICNLLIGMVSRCLPHGKCQPMHALEFTSRDQCERMMVSN